MASKRPVVVEGNTPGKPVCKRSAQYRTRRSLFDNDSEACENEQNQRISDKNDWTVAEKSALVQYICLFWRDAWNNNWPMTKDKEFWDSCAKAVNDTCNSNRTGGSCRTRVTKHLAKEYNSLAEAEESLNIDYLSLDCTTNPFGQNGNTPKRSTMPMVDDPLSPIFRSSPVSKDNDTEPSYVGDVVHQFMACLKSQISSRLRTQILKYIFKMSILDSGGLHYLKFVDYDFLDTSLNAMKTLYNEGKHNLILELSKCFEQPSDGNQTRMPLNRMPYGLLDYNIRFFSCSNTRKLGYEEHYAEWLDTMFAQFGHKWLCLHRGPAWQYQFEFEFEKKSEENLLEIALHQSGIDLQEITSSIESSIEESAFEQSLFDVSYVCNDESFEVIYSSLSDLSLSACDENVCEAAHELQPASLIKSSLSLPADHDSTIDVTSTCVPCQWTCIRDSDKHDIESGLVCSKEMEKYHGIQPTMGYSRAYRNPAMFDPLKSKVNIASLGPRAIQKRIASSEFSRTVDIQMEVLKQAHHGNPNGRWWLKADACDVRKGLRESMRGCWEGDEDFGCGSLQVLFGEYKSRLGVVEDFGTPLRRLWLADTVKVKDELSNDLEFLKKGSDEASQIYNRAVADGRSAEKKLMELAWSATEFQELVKKAEGFGVEIDNVVEGYNNGVMWNLVSMKVKLKKYLKDLFLKKRVAAKYLLVFMISDELRNRKPYAIPVQFLPYKSITDGTLRDLQMKLQEAMESTGMTVVGLTTDGEFNSLRTTGMSRPISIIGVIMDAKRKARSMRGDVIASYFKVDDQGNTLNIHPAVPTDDVIWLHDFMKQGNTQVILFADAIYILRRKLFPLIYDPNPWIEGRAETTHEVLKSIMAIYLFRMMVINLRTKESDPADFSNYLYQPEGSLNELFHHREDHNHLLKRIVSCLRDGRIPGIDLRHLREALHDSSTGLTYESLTGKNKQSVPDCERLIGTGVISFLERMGYTSSAHVIKIIHNWHKAIDGRGLSETVRSSYCKTMKDWILHDWMPWFSFLPDYSTIDVNRPIKGICGLTREVVVGLVANLDSREIRRQEYVKRGLAPEHPRASATDDVEGLFSLIHEMLGDIFDLKQFHDCQSKILNEFTKRINPDLKFFYWTGTKERYSDFDLPSFNEPSGVGMTERLDKVNMSRRGDPGIFVANRASLPQRGQLTARAKFHRAPVELPPHQLQH